jgi:hypothetical protein
MTTYTGVGFLPVTASVGDYHIDGATGRVFVCEESHLYPKQTAAWKEYEPDGGMVKNRALVCVFTHPDGRSRPLGVTRNISEDGWYVLLYKKDGEASVTLVYGTIGACDAEFMSTVEDWAMEGFVFNRSIEIPVPPFGANEYTGVWADTVLDSVVIPVKKRVM